MSPELQKDLEVICAQINKKYGKGSVQKLNDTVLIDPENITPTGSLSLDLALGIGGYPDGRIIEVYGQESAGKSTLCLHAVANAQARGKNCVYIDAEHSLDPRYAEALGVDVDQLIISQPDYGEQALDIVDMFVRSGKVGLIVVDSVAALIPKAELEGDIGDSSIGTQARMMSQTMRKITAVCNKTGCTVMFVNQIRQKIGVMFGSPNVTSGGNALKFYSSIRLEIIRTGNIMNKDEIVGNKTKVKVVKNKMAPPKKEVEFSILFGRGIDRDKEMLDLAVMDLIIGKNGSWFKYEENNIAQGELNAIQWLNENPEIKTKIFEEIRSNRGLD